MRKGSEGSSIITTDITEGSSPKGGRIIGLSLGYDFCAEHEWGIEGIRSAFGIPGLTREHAGADARTVTLVPGELKFFENLGGYAYLLFTDWFQYAEEKELTAERFDGILDAGRDEGLSTAWDERSFGVRMKNDALALGTTMLGQMYEAFTKRDAMVFLGGRRNPFAGSGLMLTIRSRMPEEALTKMKEADTDSLNLAKAAEATGIKEQLKIAGKRFYALSPRWKPTDGNFETQHPVIFWLNPREQQENNYGWFTVEQLLEWTNGKGPVPMQKAA